jgi:2-keto-4-pentenoate hydratase
MFSDIEWLLNELSKINKSLKKGDLILIGAFGPPIPIEENEFIEVKSSLIGEVNAKFI